MDQTRSWVSGSCQDWCSVSYIVVDPRLGQGHVYIRSWPRIEPARCRDLRNFNYLGRFQQPLKGACGSGFGVTHRVDGQADPASMPASSLPSCSHPLAQLPTHPSTPCLARVPVKSHLAGQKCSSELLEMGQSQEQDLHWSNPKPDYDPVSA